MNLKAFTPSLLSASIDIFITIVFTTAAYIAAIRPHSSALNQAFYLFHNEFIASYNKLASKLAENRIINDLPLILFWVLVGVAVYFVVIEIIKSVNSTIELADDIKETKVSKRQAILKETGIRSLIRAVTVIVWYIYLRLFILKFIPLDLSYINRFATSRTVSNAINFILIAIVLLVLLHINTVIFRFIALKRRLISKYEN